jgi:protein transport protein SEC24
MWLHSVRTGKQRFITCLLTLLWLACLPKFTGGQTYYYPGFNAQRPEDAEKFAHEFSHFLQNETGLEAVLRIRASRGK